MKGAPTFALAVLLVLALGLDTWASVAHAQIDPHAVAENPPPPWVWPESFLGKVAMASVFGLLTALFTLVAGGVLVTFAWLIAWGISQMDRSEGTAQDRRIKRVAIGLALALALYFSVSTAIEMTARTFS